MATLHICTPNSRTALRPGSASPTDTNEGSAMSFILAPLVKTVSSPPTGAHMVLSLPVSTTSYSRHAVSTVQTRSAGPDNGTGLNRHRRRHTLHPFHIHNHIHLRPVSISLSSSILSPITLPSKILVVLYLASDRKSPNFYQVLFKHGSTNDLYIY